MEIEELWQEILLSVLTETLPQLLLVNKQFYRICNDRVFWIERFRRENLAILERYEDFKGWYSVYNPIFAARDFISSIDPSGKYLEFCKAFLNDTPKKPNILWVYGAGSNGKMTLFRAFCKAFPDKICRHCPCCDSIICDGIKLVDSTFSPTYSPSDASYYPNICFIIHTNEYPPNGLKCETVHCMNTFNSTVAIDVNKYRQGLISLIKK